MGMKFAVRFVTHRPAVGQPGYLGFPCSWKNNTLPVPNFGTGNISLLPSQGGGIIFARVGAPAPRAVFR